MNKREFLKSLGVLGAASVLPSPGLLAAPKNDEITSCVLIPSETAGPFPLDLTANTTFFRQDIREGKAGVQLNLKLKILGLGNCLPMQNVRVNIWHCDKDGLYSGYSQTNNPGQAGLTYLRGYQITDANGEVNFTTIFPGWYTGRICHIHFQVYVSSSYSAVSQLTFDLTAKNALYTSNSGVYTKGVDPLTYSSDNIFSDGYQYQLATLTPNSTTGGYDSTLEVSVQGNGTVGFGQLEKQAAKNMLVGQNYPNPYTDKTTLPIELLLPGDVTIRLYDLQGRECYRKNMYGLEAGKHRIEMNFAELGLATSTYAWQTELKNANGVFHDLKLITHASK